MVLGRTEVKFILEPFTLSGSVTGGFTNHLRAVYFSYTAALLTTALQNGLFYLSPSCTKAKSPRTHARRDTTHSRPFFDAGLSCTQICLQTNHTYKQVCAALKHRLTLQKKKTDREVLNTPQKKRLIEWVTASKSNRETPWIEIPSILGLDCGEKAIRAAFKRQGFVRRLSGHGSTLSLLGWVRYPENPWVLGTRPGVIQGLIY